MLATDILNLFCSRLIFTSWLQNYLLPCPFKYLTGIDCPGCGFQRSVIALLQGNIHQSFALYPPAIPLILFFAYGIADKFLKLDNEKGQVKKTFFMVAGIIVLTNYIFKVAMLYRHYNTLAFAIM